MLSLSLRQCLTAALLVATTACTNSPTNQQLSGEATSQTGGRTAGVSDAQVKADASQTGYFFVELMATTKGDPYYISQCLTLTYTDDKDLDNQLKAYEQKLADAAKNDGADLKNYNRTASIEAKTPKDCTDNRKDAIEALKRSGIGVSEKNI